MLFVGDVWFDLSHVAIAISCVMLAAPFQKVRDYSFGVAMIGCMMFVLGTGVTIARVLI